MDSEKVFSSAEIMKLIDVHGGTLNYEGIMVLNDVEVTVDFRMCRLFPMPACLTCITQKLENKGNLCPFQLVSTDFGEGWSLIMLEQHT